MFLGPGGAQFNVPQMYWFDIGTSVDAVYAHTYAFNRLYRRPISPLGQVYNSPPARDIRRFRQLSRSTGRRGVSWWDWQEAPASAWRAVSQPVGWLSNFTADTSLARLGSGAQGDVVVWAQEHLVSAGENVAIDGAFGPNTQAAVQRFQTAHGLSPTAASGQRRGKRCCDTHPCESRGPGAARGSPRSQAGRRLTPVPKSASLPAKRDEIAGAGGAGAPSISARPPTSSEQTVLSRVGDQLGASRTSGLLLDVGSVGLDGSHTQIERARRSRRWYGPARSTCSTSTSRPLRSSGGPAATGGSAASRAPSSGFRYVRPSAASLTA